jgi:probable HAF family extracellular repeat protein
VSEVGAINDYCLDMRALNDTGHIVGNVRVLPDAAPHAFSWQKGGQIQDLGTLGGTTSYATDVNARNQVVGFAHASHTAMRAFLRSGDMGLVDLGTLGGRNSAAKGINHRGDVVGNSLVNEGEPQPGADRAFIWTPEGGMVSLDPTFQGWSRAYAITNAGIVIGWRGRGRGTDCGYVWFPEGGTVEIVIGPGRPFYLCAINESGLVVGEGDDGDGKRRPFIWKRETGLTQLNVDEPFHPMDVDSSGNIIGNVYGGNCPWTRPYLYTFKGEFRPLPFAEEHHTEVVAINDRGHIVGAARTSSWKHIHPLIWRLVPSAAAQPLQRDVPQSCAV